MCDIERLCGIERNGIEVVWSGRLEVIHNYQLFLKYTIHTLVGVGDFHELKHCCSLLTVVGT